MNQQTLILDLDDTLIHCNKYFVESRNRFANVMKKWFTSVSKQEILEKQSEIDIKGVEKNGLHSSLYTQSLVATYRYFCLRFGRRLKGAEINQIQKIGQSVFQRKVKPFPYMYEILDTLQADGHQLLLFTGGDEANQRRKITQLRLTDYFEDRIFIFEHKNTDSLQQILNNINTDKKCTWMIGNSLKTDIKPALELGINAIHIPAEIEWSYNIVDIEIEPSGTYAQLKSLVHLPEFIREQAYNTALNRGRNSVKEILSIYLNKEVQA
ncbi:HAD family hydrolase [Neobacillus sp. MER 74]|uniref:HAD family hydrolase n=1 Tax=Neobacillus sp. MER 74 TaxID=2939566 RepID=UPI0020425F71|nr:HAD family hydrolase [Neobacillus sp. MER 74]MCM3117429.1 HAD family hydrolase [Neobacillus sp. MER 74]